MNFESVIQQSNRNRVSTAETNLQLTLDVISATVISFRESDAGSKLRWIISLCRVAFIRLFRKRLRFACHSGKLILRIKLCRIIFLTI